MELSTEARPPDTAAESGCLPTAPHIPPTAYSHLFPIPFMLHVWQDANEYNRELRQRIFAQAKLDDGEERSNIGGWHSETGNLDFLGDAGQRLIRHMYEMANEATARVLAESGLQPIPFQWTFAAWATICRSGNYHTTHTHPGATWSGVYYVDAGDSTNKSNSALLQLQDPCQGRANLFFPHIVPNSMHVRPRAGMMILFPAYLPHMVYAHEGSNPRVAIAFNLRKEPYP